MAYSSCSVVSLNGAVYFHLYKNSSTGILTSLSVFESTSYITVTNYTHTKSENLSDISGSPTVAFNSTTCPLILDPQISTPIVPIITQLSPFMSFSDKIFAY